MLHRFAANPINYWYFYCVSITSILPLCIKVSHAYHVQDLNELDEIPDFY